MESHINTSIYDVQDFFSQIVSNVVLPSMDKKPFSVFEDEYKCYLKTTELYRPLTASELRNGGRSRLRDVIHRTPDRVDLLLKATKIKDDADLVVKWKIELKRLDNGTDLVSKFLSIQQIQKMAFDGVMIPSILQSIMNFFIFIPFQQNHLTPTFGLSYQVPSDPDDGKRVDAQSFNIFGCFDTTNAINTGLHEVANNGMLLKMAYAGSIFYSPMSLNVTDPVSLSDRRDN